MTDEMEEDIFIKSKEICTNDLEKILELLVSFEKKYNNFSNGNLVKLAKLQELNRNQKFSNTPSIHVALEIFSHNL